MIVTAVVAMYIRNAKQAFDFVILVGAGTGLLFILRWFWWKINAWCEIVAMVVSFVVAIALNTTTVTEGLKQFCSDDMVGPTRIIIGVSLTTLAWLITALVTKPTDKKVLRNFCSMINPSGPGWKKIFNEAEAEGEPITSEHNKENLPLGIVAMFVGSITVYSILFATGYWLYGETLWASTCTVIAVVSSALLALMWKGLTADRNTPSIEDEQPGEVA
jgi:hypothetical protein